MESKKTDTLTYEKAIGILRYEPETGLLERKLRNGDWRICGDKPRRDGYARVWVDGKFYYPHRLAWLLVYRECPDFIDHIDRNKMNNRIENLRAVTPSENSHNLGMHHDNTSGYPGVSFHRRCKKYQAQTAVNGKNIYLGLYATAEEAHVAYMLAKIKYHPTSPDAQEYIRELTLAG